MFADGEPGGHAPLDDPDGRDGKGDFAAGAGGGDPGDDTEDGGRVPGVTAVPGTTVILLALGRGLLCGFIFSSIR